MSQTYSGIFPIQPGTQRDPSKLFVAVTPDDDTQQVRGRGLFVGTGGDVNVIAWNDSTLTPVLFKNVNSGQILPIECLYIMATSTSAADMVILQ